MAHILNKFDPHCDITYVYEPISYQDKEKQQSRSKQTLTLIGKIHKEAAKMIPNTDKNMKLM